MAACPARKSVLEGILFLLFLGEAASLCAQSNDAPSEPIAEPVLGPRNPRLTEAVLASVKEDSRKLDKAECRRIFADFADASGRPLQQNLDALGRTGQAQLRWLIFYNASSKKFCGNRDTVAATNPRARFIHLCQDRLGTVNA